MARPMEWQYGGEAKFKDRNAYAGFRWKYVNTEEEALASNKDLIRVEPYSYKTSSITTYDEQWEDVYLVCKYTGFSGGYKSIHFERRIHFNKGSTNAKYYFSPTRTYSWTGGTSYNGSTIQIATPYPPKLTSNGKVASSALTLFNDTGNCGYIFELEHNADGTPMSGVEILISNKANPASNTKGIGTSSYTCTPRLNITLDTFTRGTRVYRYNGNEWQKVGEIHVKGESEGAQHFIYKYNGNEWVKYYG